MLFFGTPYHPFSTPWKMQVCIFAIWENFVWNFFQASFPANPTCLVFQNHQPHTERADFSCELGSLIKAGVFLVPKHHPNTFGMTGRHLALYTWTFQFGCQMVPLQGINSTSPWKVLVYGCKSATLFFGDLKILVRWCIHYPYHPCMIYLPLFTYIYNKNQGNLGKYTIHGSYV